MAILYFSDILEKTDLPYAANNYVNALIALGRNKDAKEFVKNSEFKIAKAIKEKVKNSIIKTVRSLKLRLRLLMTIIMIQKGKSSI